MAQLTEAERNLVTKAITQLAAQSSGCGDVDLSEDIKMTMGLLKRLDAVGVGPEIVSSTSGVPLWLVRALVAGRPPGSLARIEVDALLDTGLSYVHRLPPPRQARRKS